MKPAIQFDSLTKKIKFLAKDLGFDDLAICDASIRFDRKSYLNWIKKNFNGSMSYLERNIEMRLAPRLIRPTTASIICVIANYLNIPLSEMDFKLKDKRKGYISAYASGKDYHKIIRKKLLKLSKGLEQEIGPFGYRVFTDSAPIYEKPLAQNSGLGWIGKNTILINKSFGSFFFLGEIFTDLKLPAVSSKKENLCGTCTNCLDVCPTKALVAPYKLDSRRCISYLTIESKASIPMELRDKIGNRIFGCDDCQIFCPWNKYAKIEKTNIFSSPQELDSKTLLEMFLFNEEDFKRVTVGTAMRRINYKQWLRNLAIAIGNSPSDEKLLSALQNRLNHPDELVREHIEWAFKKQYDKIQNKPRAQKNRS